MTSTYIEDLAKRFEEDIHAQGLREGDSYYNTTEAAEAFGVSRETARKVMQLLAEKDLLVRYRRRGTFAGPGAGKRGPANRHETVLLLEPTRPGWPPSGLFTFPALLDQVLAGSDIRTHILPNDRELDGIKALIAPALHAGQLDGVVTTARTREVYEYLSEIDAPVVLLGTLDSGMPELPTVDMDFHHAGRLLAEHLAAKGRKRFLVQLEHSYGGAHRFMDGILDALSAAGLPPNAVTIRVFDGDFETTAANCRHLFRMKTNRPDAVIAEGRILSDLATAAARDAGLEPGKDVEMACSIHEMGQRHDLPHACTASELDAQGIAGLTAQMLTDQLEGRPLPEKHLFIPVQLVLPSNKGQT